MPGKYSILLRKFLEAPKIVACRGLTGQGDLPQDLGVVKWGSGPISMRVYHGLGLSVNMDFRERVEEHSGHKIRQGAPFHGCMLLDPFIEIRRDQGDYLGSRPIMFRGTAKLGARLGP
jgi:hypothetical protein